MNVLKPHLQTTIWTLLKGGATQREIERITGISRHTIRTYQQRLAVDPANCPGVATDPPSQTAPPWPPTFRPVSLPLATSKCELHRAFIDAQLRLGRNATAIYQDLVDLHGFDGAYNSVKRFVAQLRRKEPEQFDRLAELPKPLQRLRSYRGRRQTQLGLRLLLLTGVRTGELRQATPDQFDLDRGLWIIPPDVVKQLQLDMRKKRQQPKDIPPYIVPGFGLGRLCLRRDARRQQV